MLMKWLLSLAVAAVLQGSVIAGKKCGKPMHMNHGHHTYNDTHIGAVVTYECAYGHFLIGDVERTCQDLSNTGQPEWSGIMPHCTAIKKCPPVYSLAHGYVNYTEHKYGDNITYTCNEGYHLTAAAVRTCIDFNNDGEGDWSGEKPHCIEIKCKPIDHITDGQINATGHRYNDTIIFTCNVGYHLDGDALRICGDFDNDGVGDWSGEKRHCREIRCPRPDGILHGNVSYDGSRYNQTATYNCDPGYELTGEPVRTCEDVNGDGEGEWSGERLHCRIPLCPKPETILHGTFTHSGKNVGDTLTYTCTPGHSLTGDKEMTCEVSKEAEQGADWIGETPTCTKPCKTLENPENGEVLATGTNLGDIASYSCYEGYVLNGNTSRTCENNNDEMQWSGDEPNCEYEVIAANNAVEEQDTCKILENPENGQVTSTGVNNGDQATYSCSNGYDLNGDSVRTCENNYGELQWSGYEPTCTAAIKEVCEELEPIENAVITYTGRDVNDRATITCKKDHVLRIDNKDFNSGIIRICNANGQWSQLDANPYCFNNQFLQIIEQLGIE